MSNQKPKEAEVVEFIPNNQIQTHQSSLSLENYPTYLEGDPESIIDYAVKASKALKKIVDSKKKKVVINGEQYLEFEDWQTIARFYGATVGTEFTKKIMKDGKLQGYEAKAVVYRRGEIISSAEASCLRDERNWGAKPEFQLKSMAQTRACAKALRNAFAWVVVLAGYQPTPAEEMTMDEFKSRQQKPQSRQYSSGPKKASQKQIQMIIKLAGELGADTSDPAKLREWIIQRTQVNFQSANQLSVAEASEIISRLTVIKKERYGQI